jgi:hypothetical protein
VPAEAATGGAFEPLAERPAIHFIICSQATEIEYPYSCRLQRDRRGSKENPVLPV